MTLTKIKIDSAATLDALISVDKPGQQHREQCGKCLNAPATMKYYAVSDPRHADTPARCLVAHLCDQCVPYTMPCFVCNHAVFYRHHHAPQILYYSTKQWHRSPERARIACAQCCLKIRDEPRCIECETFIFELPRPDTGFVSYCPSDADRPVAWVCVQCIVKHRYLRCASDNCAYHLRPCELRYNGVCRYCAQQEMATPRRGPLTIDVD